MDSNLFPRKQRDCHTRGCIYSRSMDQPYPRKCERCGVDESGMTPKPDDLVKAIEECLKVLRHPKLGTCD